jgi:hypothetical protein
MSRIAARVFLLCLPVATASAQPSGNVTVYRCTGSDGHVTLTDRPCASGTAQQVRTLQRPQDAPPPRPMTAAVDPRPAEPAPVVQTVVMRTPQPMYECITPDGKRYTSETGDGNPRWVPLWTLGYRARRIDHQAANDNFNAYVRDRPLGGYVGLPPKPDAAASNPPPPPPHRPHLGSMHSPATGGTWVRDTCHPLPQAEVCARLKDRREEIRRRFFNAQESERNELRREERGINARLQADCA